MPISAPIPNERKTEVMREIFVNRLPTTAAIDAASKPELLEMRMTVECEIRQRKLELTDRLPAIELRRSRVGLVNAQALNSRIMNRLSGLKVASQAVAS